jgi:hypothetical protein
MEAGCCTVKIGYTYKLTLNSHRINLIILTHLIWV